MGGTNAKNINLTPSKATEATEATEAGKSSVLNSIKFDGENGEIHENGGEVHFHNRKTKAKVAVPVPDFHILFNDWILSPSKPLVFLDSQNQARVVISTVESISGDVITIDIEARIEALRIMSNFRKLIDFSLGK